jgi:hypothetical protein|tara:strand:- start:433 stop:738 length:306 start_codon:yes stop_codon:yes gene_type:complete
MAKYALGKNAYGISDRSGFRYRLHRMRKEWTGMLVGFDEYEPKHPQLGPVRKFSDPQALKNPRPDRVEPVVIYVDTPLLSEKTFTPIRAYAVLGQVTVTTS